RGHCFRGTGRGRRWRLYGRRKRDHQRRPTRGARHRSCQAEQHRGIRRPEEVMTAPTSPTPTLNKPVSALSPRPVPASSLPLCYDKRLMLFSGRANPELASKISGKLGVDLGGVTLKTFSNGEVYCRYEESIRGADVFIVQPTCGNPATGINANDALMELLV